MQCIKCLLKPSFEVHNKSAKYCLDCKFLVKKLLNKLYRKGKLQGIDRVREKVRVRDNHICQDCGKKWEKGKRRFDCHHLNGLCGKRSKKYDKVSEMKGLITLCHKCHFNRPEHSTKKKKLCTVYFTPIYKDKSVVE